MRGIDPMRVGIGEKVRALRKRLGMNQSELANAIGVDQSSVSRLENGTTHPKVEMLQHIADLAGVPLTSIIAVGLHAVGVDAGSVREDETAYGNDVEAIEVALVGMEGTVAAMRDQGQPVSSIDKARIFRSLYQAVTGREDARGGGGWTAAPKPSTEQPTEQPQKPCVTNDDSHEP